MKYGTLADMETINNLLIKASRAFTSLKETLTAAKEDTETRALRNADLRNQLQDMKRNMDSGMMDLMNEMAGLAGIDPSAGIRDEKEVREHLTKAFNKFDSNKSGTIDFREFRGAWKHLGLSGSDNQLNE